MNRNLIALTLGLLVGTPEQSRNKVKSRRVLFGLQPAGPLWCICDPAGWPLWFTGGESGDHGNPLCRSGLRTNP